MESDAYPAIVKQVLDTLLAGVLDFTFSGGAARRAMRRNTADGPICPTEGRLMALAVRRPAIRLAGKRQKSVKVTPIERDALVCGHLGLRRRRGPFAAGKARKAPWCAPLQAFGNGEMGYVTQGYDQISPVAHHSWSTMPGMSVLVMTRN